MPSLWTIFTVLFLTIIFITGQITAEWEVFNDDTIDSDAELNLIPSKSTSSSSSKSSSSSSSKTKKNKDAMTIAKSTYQSTASPDPFKQFQDVSFTTSIPSSKIHSKPENTNKPKSKSKNLDNVDSKAVSSTSSKSPKTEIPVKVSSEKGNTIRKEVRKLEKIGTLKFEEINAIKEEVVDCDDELNMNDVDCLFLHSSHDGRTEEMNMSEAGLLARDELLPFEEMGSRLSRMRRQTVGSGDGVDDTETLSNGTYQVSSSISFNMTQGNMTQEEIKQSLKQQLTNTFQNLRGFENVVVTNVSTNPNNGLLTAEWTLVVSGLSAYGRTAGEASNNLKLQFRNVSNPLYEQISLGGVTPMDPLQSDNLANNLASQAQDICAVKNCSTAFESCVNSATLDQATCSSKCAVFESTTPCEHGGTCELRPNSQTQELEAYCRCSSQWQGELCEDRAPVSLDPGKITGITLGAVVAVASTIGCCCWLLVCRRRRKPLSMTEFDDDNSSTSEQFTSPASKIGTFVIDRPKVSKDPIRSFSPHFYDDFSRPSTLSSLPSRMQPRQSANLFSDA